MLISTRIALFCYLCATKIAELNKKIRVGIVSYLNSRPLLYGLKMPPVSNLIELVEDHPANLALQLEKGEIDVGLIPVAAIPRFQEYHICGNYCIGAEGEVASVCLFSEVPLEEIEKVYLDYQSRTSVALLQWLMKEYWGIQPELIQATDESYRKNIKDKTAGLVIGDRAFEQRRISTFIYDLGSEWKKITGLPFVFAAWISTRPLPVDFIQMFDECIAKGLQQIDSIVEREDFEMYDLKKYYHSQISYQLDEAKHRGLKLFLEYISEPVIF